MYHGCMSDLCIKVHYLIDVDQVCLVKYIPGICKL